MRSDSSLGGSALSRRGLLRGAVGLSAGAAVAALAGCSTTGSSSGAARIKPKPDGDITWFTWAEYVDPHVLSEFESKYKVKVKLELFDSDDTMLQKLASGLPYDLVTNNSAYMKRSIEGGLVRPIVYDDLKNIDQLVPFFAKPPYDAGSHRYSIPYGLSSTGILLRTDKVTHVDGWNTLWDAAKELPRHVTVLPQTEETIGMSLIRLGDPLNSGDKTQVTKAVDELLTLKPGLLRVSSDTTNDVQGGSAWAVHTWPGSAYQVLTQMKDASDWTFIQPKEGVPFGGDLLTIGANAKAPGTALLLMDWMLRPENSVRNVAFTGYPNGSKSGDAKYADLVKKYPYLNMGENVYERADWKESPTGARLSLYTAQWNRFVA